MRMRKRLWIPVSTPRSSGLRNVVTLLSFSPSDPEEFLNKLFQLLRVEPLLKIR